jgi:putative glutamine amidotransferase
MDTLDGLVLSGGGDVLLRDESGLDEIREMDRDRDFWEAALLKEAMGRRMPVLGVCRGLQLMNLFLGGTLWRDVPTQYSEALLHQQTSKRTKVSHPVRIMPDSLLARLCGGTEILVNSGHHQAVRIPAPGLMSVGHSPDGLIEAMEDPGQDFFLGVQWHPESLAATDPAALSLFQGLVGAAAVYRASMGQSRPRTARPSNKG